MNTNLKRIVSLTLAVLLTVNTPIALAANARSSAASSARRHSVTLTADALAGKLLPLESSASVLEDHGDHLRNADGVADTQIQGTYYAYQTLASVSFAGTSFSFAPLMLDAYDPQPGESPAPTDSPEPSVSPEPSETPEAEATPELRLTAGYAKTVSQADVYASSASDDMIGTLDSEVVVYLPFDPAPRQHTQTKSHYKKTYDAFFHIFGTPFCTHFE